MGSMFFSLLLLVALSWGMAGCSDAEQAASTPDNRAATGAHDREAAPKGRAGAGADDRRVAAGSLEDLVARTKPTGLKVMIVGIDGATYKVLNPLLEAGRLPSPTVDVATAWRPTVAGALRTGADRFQRDSHRMLSVQVTALDRALPADVMLQQDSRVLDPASGFGRRMLNLRDRLVGQEATLAVSCRLEDRPGSLNQDRVLVIENERGVQERIALDGASRSLSLDGPAGRTNVMIDAHGVRVAEASCRHATCRLQGAIARPGELIACAPNRLVLRVETA